jgi:hypothetical protein
MQTAKFTKINFRPGAEIKIVKYDTGV